jgi:hypothetical protein
MDRFGNLALGYSVSSKTLFPSIRYATRLSTDPAGTLGAETELQAGAGVQKQSFNRWGDYSSMNVDPADNCTSGTRRSTTPIPATSTSRRA